MYVKYGAFEFEPWEAGIRVAAEFQRSVHGFKHLQIVRYDIAGELCEDGEDDTDTRLKAVIAAFSTDRQDVGLMHSDDSPTAHFLPTNATYNLTGNQVYYKRLPETRDGEFVSGRKFEIGVGAILLDPEAELLEHQDSMQRTSNAGAEYRWRRKLAWGWYPEKITPNTMQVIHHTGYRIGATTWPLPITPFYSSPFEANHLRVVQHVSPRRYPRGFTGYKTTWSYTYMLPTFDDITMPLRT